MTKRVSGELIGVWKRQSIAIQDDPASEDSDVIWIQAATRYADLRVALPGYRVDPLSFAGTLEWDAPVLTFHHELDLSGEGALDSGRLDDIASQDLIETGSFEVGGREIRYREHWQRLTELHPSFYAFESRSQQGLSAIAVEVADHRLVISDDRPAGGVYSAAYARRIRGAWQVQRSIGSRLALAEVADLGTRLTRVD